MHGTTVKNRKISEEFVDFNSSRDPFHSFWRHAQFHCLKRPRVFLDEQSELFSFRSLCSCKKHLYFGGFGSSVGMATGYGLDSPGIESRWGSRFSAPVQTGPGAHPASCKMGTGSFPAVKSGRDVTLTPHPLLVPWSRKSRAIPLLPLWAVWLVESLSACTRVHFTIFLF